MGTSVPGTPASPARQLPSDAGEPACLLHLVCDACGRLDAAGEGHCCTGCGTPLDDGNDGNDEKNGNPRVP
ncbi:hypothetical protein ACFV4Q_06595 [Streptomyces nojiriensis]|uniref:hypothetical protein n=1 Tax=Streptomyces nojiriensis TaxID=66374 RepID=UPI003661E12A